MNSSLRQPSSDDRDELARLLPAPDERDLPSGRQRQLQEFVMNQVHQDLRSAPERRRPVARRRFALATSALAAAAVAAVAIGTHGADSGSGQVATPAQSTTVSLSPVAQTFELAASYAAARPYTPPRADQWIYIQNRNVNPSALATDKGQDPDVTTQLWLRADGLKMGGTNPDSGQFETWDQDNDYPRLATLPTDPAELLALLRAELTAPPRVPAGSPAPPVAEMTPEDREAALFRRIAMILDGYVLPPAVTAALWRAAALVPGVSQSDGPIEVGGLTVIAVGRVQHGWQFEQLLLDPDTHDYVGYRSVAVADHAYTGGPNGPVTEKKGTVQFATTRLAAVIVNAAGQTS